MGDQQGSIRYEPEVVPQAPQYVHSAVQASLSSGCSQAGSYRPLDAWLDATEGRALNFENVLLSRALVVARDQERVV